MPYTRIWLSKDIYIENKGNSMAGLKDAVLAANFVRWLESKGCYPVTPVLKEDGWYIHYTLKNDMKPQPAVRIINGSVMFPEGSQEDVIFDFLMQN